MSMNEKHEENCLLVVSTETRVYQNTDLDSYSLLINTNNAMISFKALTNCNQSYFEIHAYGSESIEHPPKIYSRKFS